MMKAEKVGSAGAMRAKRWSLPKKGEKWGELVSALTPRSAPHAARTHPQDEQGR
jgi:hypothetical protein